MADEDLNRVELHKLSLRKLKDLLHRQQTLSSNKYLISVLPDHGAKIRSKIVQLQTLIRSKEDLTEAMDQLSHLQLSEKIGQYSRFVTVKGGPDSDDDGDSDGDDGDVDDDGDVGDCNVGDDSNDGDVGDGDSANGDISKSKVENMDADQSSCRAPHNKKKTTPAEIPGAKETQRSEEEKLSAFKSRLKKISVKEAKLLTMEESLLIQQEQKKREEEISSKRAVAKLLETAGQFSLGLPDGTAQFGYRTRGDDSEDDSKSASDDDDDDDIVGETLDL